MCVCLGACVWAMIPWYIFILPCEEATVGAVTAVSSGSLMWSQIFTLMCFLFFLCRAHWDTWDTSGRDACFVHWSTLVDRGGRSQSWGQASTLFFVPIAPNYQFIFWLLSSEQPPGTMLLWNWGKRKVAVCKCIQKDGFIAVEVIFLLHRNIWVKDCCWNPIIKSKEASLDEEVPDGVKWCQPVFDWCLRRLLLCAYSDGNQ